MTISDKRECLKYRYLSSKETVGSWGHEYVRFNLFYLFDLFSCIS